MKRKITSILLALALIIGLLPTAISVTEDDVLIGTYTNKEYGSFTLLPNRVFIAEMKVNGRMEAFTGEWYPSVRLTGGMFAVLTAKDERNIFNYSTRFRLKSNPGKSDVLYVDSLSDFANIPAETQFVFTNSTIPATAKPSAWAETEVNKAITSRLVPPDLQLMYKQAVTRAEFCALAVMLYENSTGTFITERKSFSDTNDPNVEKMAGLGVVNGDAGKFNPKDKLTREQAATLIVNLTVELGKPFPKKTATFADNGSISTWAVGSVGQVQAAGIMGTTGGNKFSPKDPYTREQSIVTILRLYDIFKGSFKYNYNIKAWALGCSAIMAKRYLGYDPYEFGMMEKNEVNASLAALVLSSSWNVNSRDDLINTIKRMTDSGHSNSFAESYKALANGGGTTNKQRLTKTLGDKWGDKQIKAWDWFRMIHLSGWGYVAGYLEADEAYNLMTPVIERLHSTFSSWDEATENYMDGYAWWSDTDVSEPNTEYTLRLEFYDMLKDLPNERNLFDPSVWDNSIKK